MQAPGVAHTVCIQWQLGLLHTAHLSINAEEEETTTASPRQSTIRPERRSPSLQPYRKSFSSLASLDRDLAGAYWRNLCAAHAYLFTSLYTLVCGDGSPRAARSDTA